VSDMMEVTRIPLLLKGDEVASGIQS